jgi:hypothetical protein
MTHLIAANLHILQQGEALLRRLGDDVYTRCLPAVFGSSIGAHIRHNLDHYACFLNDLPAGSIDYTARPRDAHAETECAVALAEIARIGEAFAALELNGGALRVRSESNPHGTPAPSSMARELEFLLSHTVHHYAIVAILCRLQGVDIDSGFGVAPSTLRYHAECETSCAR